MKYTVLIATRNRAHALELSLPRIVSQSLPPSQILVVDSSDDHEKVKSTCDRILLSSSIEYQIVKAPRGAVVQRNIGINLVKHPIVLFPDDDSILFPDAAQKMVAVYSSDSSCKIAGVCAFESTTPPPGFEDASAGYQMRKSDRLKTKIQAIRRRIESFMPRDPAFVLGSQFIQKFDFSGLSPISVPVEWMTGFRMSFRLSAISRERFDETLTNYSLFEDVDASFSCWRQGCIVAAKDAYIYHHKSPESRDRSESLGFDQLVNKAYIVAKHSDKKSPARSAIKSFAVYKTLQYLAAFGSKKGRARFRGAFRGLKHAFSIAGVDAVDARSAYVEAQANRP